GLSDCNRGKTAERHARASIAGPGVTAATASSSSFSFTRTATATAATTRCHGGRGVVGGVPEWVLSVEDVVRASIPEILPVEDRAHRGRGIAPGHPAIAAKWRRRGVGAVVVGAVGIDGDELPIGDALRPDDVIGGLTQGVAVPHLTGRGHSAVVAE